MILRVGITGGIGSGKSTIARIFQVLGVPVYNSDAAAKRLMQEDPGLRASIARLFGDAAYTDTGLNRKWIADKAFQDPSLLQALNELVHPATLRDAAVWMQQQTAPYCVKEAALIFESGAQKDLDYVIGVSAPESLRIERAMQRDGLSREEVKARMKRQLKESVKMRLCQFIIINDEEHPVIDQVLLLHEKLLALSKARP